MMTKEEFANEMVDGIQRELGDEYEVKTQKVIKNNGVEMTGIVASSPARRIAPTIYVDGLYQDFQEGMKSVDDAVRVAAKNLREGMPSKDVDMSFYTDWNQVKDKICFRLVNAQANERLLSEVPHETYKDLALTFFYPFEDEEIGNGSIVVRNEHCERWGVSNDELIEAAVNNTPRLFPPECQPMESVLRELTGVGHPEYRELPAKPLEPESVDGMMILTNRNRVFGASVILYKDYLQRVAEAAQCDLYVIPSSIHECIILPKVEGGDVARLAEIIGEVNRDHVDPKEILSNSLYAYDRETQTLDVAVEGKGQMEGCDRDFGQNSDMGLSM